MEYKKEDKYHPYSKIGSLFFAATEPIIIGKTEHYIQSIINIG